jgi:outer membrane protein assembly factor BamD
MTVRHILGAGILLLLASCSSTKPVESADAVCREKYAKATTAFDKGRDADAQDLFKDLTVSCYGYDFQEKAQYMLAESYFRTEQWPESETEFRLLREQFERSVYAEEALYKIARCGYEQSSTWDRDPAPTLDAIRKFNEYLSDYPQGKWSEEIHKSNLELDGRLAMRTYRTAKLYIRLDEPLAATIYFKKLLKEHPGWELDNTAQIELALAYAHLDQFDQARATISGLDSSDDKAALASDIKDAKSTIASLEKSFLKKRAREAEGYKTGFF